MIYQVYYWGLISRNISHFCQISCLKNKSPYQKYSGNVKCLWNVWKLWTTKYISTNNFFHKFHMPHILRNDKIWKSHKIGLDTIKHQEGEFLRTCSFFEVTRSGTELCSNTAKWKNLFISDKRPKTKSPKTRQSVLNILLKEN